jgi:opacity protein-like surface antigen
VARGAAAMNDVAVCQSRVAMERATDVAQNETKRQPGIAFHSTVTRIPGADGLFAIALGKDEGADRGDMYLAMARGPDGTYSRIGFGRIAVAGPGGDAAETAPSHFKFRSGTVDEGVTPSADVHVEEHAQVGVPLGVRPQVNYYLMKGDLKTKLAYGGAIEGGYNASKFVPVADEVWGRACLSFVMGTDKEFFGALELSPEVVHYLGSGFAAYGGAGFALVLAQKSVDTAGANSKTESLRGISYAALLNLGLDFAVSPDWNTRLSVGYRQGLSKTKLQNDAKTVSIDGGMLSAAQAGLSAGYTF